MAIRRLIGCALLAVPCAAWSAPPDLAGGTGPYVALRLGRIAGEASGVPGRGSDVEATVGVRLVPHLGLEAAMGRYVLDTSRSYSYYSSMSGSTSVHDDHRVTSITAGLRISGRSRPRWLSLEVSFLAGVGLYSSHVARTSVFTPFPFAPPTVTPTSASESSTSGAGGGYLGLSASLVSPWGLSLGAEVRYAAVRTLEDTVASGEFEGPGGLRFGVVVAYGL